MAKKGQVVFYSGGSVKTVKGTPVDRYVTYRGRKYAIVGSWGNRKDAERSAAGFRRQFGGAIVRRLEPGNFGVYAGGTFGK